MSEPRLPEQEPEEWLDEPETELPLRPRRRLLAPLPVALLAALMAAGGFVAGVLVERGQSGSSSPSAVGSELARRFAGVSGRENGGAGGFAGLAGGGAGTGGATAGQVAFVHDGTLYVTTAEGNTVKVTTSRASTVTKTVKTGVRSIHPGETVVVTGPAAANGAIDAESIRVTEGLGGSGGAGGEPALFGKGG
jgi:hypothetical protein